MTARGPLFRASLLAVALLSVLTPAAWARSQDSDTTVTVSSEPATRAIATSGPIDLGEAHVLFAPMGVSPGGQFGNSVADAGDFNGDGYDDVIVGAWASYYQVGRAYVFYGGPAADAVPREPSHSTRRSRGA